MMYYQIEFNPKDHVTQRQVAEAYRHFVDHYTKIFPQMKLAGLFARDVLLGSQPHYFALWEMPDYATLDAWKKAYRGDPDGARLTREINDMGVDWNAKIVQKLL
jgi:NIPSNAP